MVWCRNCPLRMVLPLRFQSKQCNNTKVARWWFNRATILWADSECLGMGHTKLSISCWVMGYLWGSYWCVRHLRNCIFSAVPGQAVRKITVPGCGSDEKAKPQWACLFTQYNFTYLVRFLVLYSVSSFLLPQPTCQGLTISVLFSSYSQPYQARVISRHCFVDSFCFFPTYAIQGETRGGLSIVASS